MFSEIDDPIFFGSHVTKDDKVKRTFEFTLMCLGSFQTLKIELSVTILAQSYIKDVSYGLKYASAEETTRVVL